LFIVFSRRRSQQRLRNEQKVLLPGTIAYMLNIYLSNFIIDALFS